MEKIYSRSFKYTSCLNSIEALFDLPCECFHQLANLLMAEILAWRQSILHLFFFSLLIILRVTISFPRSCDLRTSCVQVRLQKILYVINCNSKAKTLISTYFDFFIPALDQSVNNFRIKVAEMMTTVTSSLINYSTR